eukprot:4349397-Prymnesium_polylepis.1
MSAVGVELLLLLKNELRLRLLGAPFLAMGGVPGVADPLLEQSVSTPLDETSLEAFTFPFTKTRRSKSSGESDAARPVATSSAYWEGGERARSITCYDSSASGCIKQMTSAAYRV